MIMQKWLRDNLNVSIVPCQKNSKHFDMAALKLCGYKSLEDAKKRTVRDIDLIRWFGRGARKKKNLPNSAIVTTNHLLVIDFDDIAQYQRFKLEYPTLARTMTIKSPRGYHLYFKVSEKIPNNITSSWPNVEIKHSGDCVMAIGSIVDGHTYQTVYTGMLHDMLPLTISNIFVLPMITPNHQLPSANEEKTRVQATSFLRVPPNNDTPKAKLYKGVIADIKAKLSTLDLVSRYTDLQPTGDGWHMGRCPSPDHPDKHPSFRVRDRATCLKSSCKLYDSRAMDCIEFYSRLHDLSYRDSIATLAVELGLVS